MKALIIICFIVFGYLCVSAQTPPASSAVQEADRLSGEVVKLFSEKKFEEALPLARRAISVRENELGKKHVSLAGAWRNLAYIQLQLKDLKEAETSFEKAFEIYEKNQPLSPENEKLFVEMIEAAAFFDATGGFVDKAVKKFLRAVESREKINGKDSPELSTTLLKLGQTYQVKEDYENAAPVLLRALEIRRNKLKKGDAQIAKAYREASCVFGKLGRSAELEAVKNELFPKMPKDANVKSPDAPGQITKAVINGKALSLPKPAYPREAREKRAKGTVQIQVLIDETGSVLHACAISGAKELQRVSEISAYGAKFEPTFLDGKPVKVNGVIVYNFVP
jgi:tetratricopeptide (TPR) repeat protein